MFNAKIVAEEGDWTAAIDNIGQPTPFLLTATWEKGKLRIVVEQPQVGPYWPKHEFECDLVECGGEEDEDDSDIIDDSYLDDSAEDNEP
jgi:hypothetical protein